MIFADVRKTTDAMTYSRKKEPSPVNSQTGLILYFAMHLQSMSSVHVRCPFAIIFRLYEYVPHASQNCFFVATIRFAYRL